jgi:hypothetical protein
VVGERGLSGGAATSASGSPFLSPRSSTSALLEPLEAYREGLVLARRAGMSWWDAERAAHDAALSVVTDEAERDEWVLVLMDTRTVWMRAYERRPTGCSL